MLGIFSSTFRTATRTETRPEPRPHHEEPERPRSEAQARDIERSRKLRSFGPRVWF